MNFLSLSILLLLPFTLLCLTNDVAFNVEFRDCKQTFLYHKRNLYSTNIFYYKRLQYKVFNNNVSILIHSLPISGIAYKLGGDFPSNNKKRSHTQLDSRKQVIAFQDRVMTINIKEAQHPLKREKQVIDKSSIMLKISTKSMHRVLV